jgi:hypothetical protein
MNAVWYRTRAELRRRWVATVVLALLAGVTAGIVLASVAGARRTGSAMDRFVAFNQPGTAEVGFEPGPLLDDAAIARLPQVAATTSVAYVLLAPSRADGTPDPGATGTINPFLLIQRTGVSNRPVVVDGRLPDPSAPLEIAIDEQLAERRHLRPGGVLRMYAYTSDQLSETGETGAGAPSGPRMDLRVTAVVRSPPDVVPREGDPDVIYTGTQDLYLGPAWYDRFGGRVAMFGPEGSLEVRLRHGPADLPAFERALRRLPGGDATSVDRNSDSLSARTASDRSVQFGVIAIVAFAALAAVTGIALIGQALARTLALEADDAPVLRALGLGPRSLALVAGLRSLAVALPAAVLAVAVAVALSPLFPISLARRAEIDPGVHADLWVLVPGAALVVLVVVVRGMVTGTRLALGRAGRPARPSPTASRLAEAGTPPPVVAGVRLALGPGRGRGALVGLALAVVVVVGAATFGRSLDHLAATPSLQGWNWDVVVGNGQDVSIEDQSRLLERNPLVRSWSGLMAPVDADVDGHPVPLEAVGTGHGPTEAIVRGRAPARAGEVALGQDTLDAVGARIGDRVRMRVDTAAENGQPLQGAGDLRVVGTALFNDSDAARTELGRGALVTLSGARAMGIEPFVSKFLVDYANGADEGAAYQSLQRDFGRTVLRRMNAVDVENLRRVSGLPAALAVLVGGLALAVLAHALVTTLRRRRRDLAVLRTVGFLRLQLAVAMVAFAGTIVVLAVAVGAPIGVAVGRVAWRLVAESLGTPAPAVLPVPVLLLVAPLTLLVALAVAAQPARAAAATEPALVLRSE